MFEGVEKLRTHRNCEEQNDEANQKPRFNVDKQFAFGGNVVWIASLRSQ
jgi:hypothetical protein